MKITVGQLRQLVAEAVVAVDPNYLKLKSIAKEAIAMFAEAEAGGVEARKAAPTIYKWVVEATTYEDDPRFAKGSVPPPGPLHKGLAVVTLVTKADGWLGELLRRAARDYRP